MCDSKVWIFMVILLPIERNNLNVVHGISGKLWLSRRYNRPSKTTLVNLTLHSTDDIASTLSTMTHNNSLTCKTHLTKDEAFQRYSKARTKADSSVSIVYYAGLIAILSIVQRSYINILYNLEKTT